MYKIISVLFTIPFLLLACDQTRPQNIKKIAAKYDGGEITMSTLDETIKDELFEQLYGVYYLRYIALEELIAESLLKREAEKVKLSREQLLEKKVYSKLNADGLNTYIAKYQIKSVSDPSNSYLSFPVKSKEGNQIVWESYRRWAVAEFCDDLSKRYHVNRLLTPPLSPVTNLDSIDYISTGKLSSKVNVWIMSDYDCPSCQASYSNFEQLYKKYSDKVEFRYTYLSNIPTFPAVACECADKVGKFKFVYDYLYKTKDRDSLNITRLIQAPADIKIFNSCVRNSNIMKKMNQNLKRLHERGIDETPSIFVNERLFYGQLSEKALTDYIDYCLKK